MAAAAGGAQVPRAPGGAAGGGAATAAAAAAAEPASPEREAAGAAPPRAVAAEVRWKGPRASALGSLRRAAVRRNRTRGEPEAAWEEEFESLVTLAAASQREGAAFQPWELAFCVFSVSAFSLSDFGFYYIGSCFSYSSEERSKPL